jgi:mannitol/fructose-specific phosphotransferase system IIA component (Ntr-type)
MILNSSAVNFKFKANNWREAVEESGRLLYVSDLVEEKYINALVRMVEEYGPYMVITKGIAMPHARPEDGVKKNGISLVKLTRPVNFPGDTKNNPVQVLIGLSAKTDHTHIEMMKQIAEILMSTEKTEKLLKDSSDENEIMDMLNKSFDNDLSHKNQECKGQ